jgi:hypothetical protein
VRERIEERAASLGEGWDEGSTRWARGNGHGEKRYSSFGAEILVMAVSFSPIVSVKTITSVKGEGR